MQLVMDKARSTVFPSASATSTTPQKWTKILVSMDLTLQKMKELLTITSFCHHLIELEQKDVEKETIEKFRIKLECALGKEVTNILREIISCHKTLNQVSTTRKFLPILPKPKLSELSYPQLKIKLAEQFKMDAEKRQFLTIVLKLTKEYLLCANIKIKEMEMSNHDLKSISLYDSNEDQDDDVNALQSVKIAGHSVDKPQPMVFTSAMSLLRAALNSKYQRHVRRCLKELDVESLMNILYLTYEDTTGVRNIPELRKEFQSLYEDDSDDNLGCFEANVEMNETGTDTSGEGKKEIDNFRIKSQSSESRKADSALSKEEIHSKYCNIEYFREYPLSLYCQSNTKLNIVPSMSSYDMKLMVDKLLKLYKLLRNLPNSFWADLNKIYPIGHDTVHSRNVSQYFSKFGMVVATLFENDGSENFIDISNNVINYQLLLIKLKKLQTNYETHRNKDYQVNKELDEKIFNLRDTIMNESKTSSDTIDGYIKGFSLKDLRNKQAFQKEFIKSKDEISFVQKTYENTINFVKKTTKSLRGRRHYLEASLDSLIRQYDNTMLKYQKKLDDLQDVIEENDRDTEKLQKKFKNVEENYDEMRAMRRLKELLANMEKAEVIKQNWAARKIQIAWRKYKIAKLRKKKIKGKRKGKKKTPPPQQGKAGTPPSKGSTPGSRSRSKSQTP